MRVLVVDDELTSRILLQETLARYGEVEISEDGAEAVDKCRQAISEGLPYNLICMDIMMPGMSGLEALQTIRGEEECSGLTRSDAAKVIMITAKDDSESIAQSFQSLCDAYVTKPVDMQDLLNIVDCLYPAQEQPVP
jgi:two-component system, chemotaxis family, chemotaxis protein CheY